MPLDCGQSLVNHSFGTAIDINMPSKTDSTTIVNSFGPSCRLVRGGKYQPSDPRSVTIKSAVYQAMRGIGFRWGGEIKGQQKRLHAFLARRM